MAKLRVPENQKIGLRFLFELDERLQNVLFDSIGKVEINFSSNELIEKICHEKGIKRGQVSKIIGALFGILSARTLSRVDATTFVEDMVMAFEEIDDEKLQLNDNLKAHLVKFLEDEGSAFHLKFKSTFLSRQRENILRECNVYTDIRPIFNDDGAKMLGSMILHNLKIAYVDRNSRFAEIYLALDDEDLAKLKANIIRAEEKEKSIKKKLKSVDLPLLDY